MRNRRYLRELYDQPKVALSDMTRNVKAEAIEALLCGYSTSTLRQEHYAQFRTVHHRVLLRTIEAQRKRPDHWTTSYNRALEITRCESIETTLRTSRLLLWAGTLIQMNGWWFPKRIVFGNLEDAMRRGRGAKEQEWSDCVQSDIWEFGLSADSKAAALEAEMWVETIMEGGRRFMAAWKKEELTRLDIAGRRESQRDCESWYRTRKHRTCEAAQMVLVDDQKESCMAARQTENYLAPGHVDASRDAILVICFSLCCTRLCFVSFCFSPNEQYAGGGVRCQTFFLYIFYIFSSPRA